MSTRSHAAIGRSSSSFNNGRGPVRRTRPRSRKTSPGISPRARPGAGASGASVAIWPSSSPSVSSPSPTMTKSAPACRYASGADFVILGEGELTLGELLGQIATLAPDAPAPGLALGEIPGLVFRDRGLVRRTGPRPLLKELDDLPMAAWDLVDIPRYRAFWRARHGVFALNVATTRGCPYKCNWCAKPIYGNTYHTRSPDRVIEEIRLLRDRYAPDRLWFCDDIFGLKARWLEPFAERMAGEGLAMPFLCQTRADLMNEANVGALARAGCDEAWMGVESGAQTVLDAMDKGITVDQV